MGGRVATPPASPPLPGRPGSGLTGDLITLAGTPDDGSDVPTLLHSITRFAAEQLPPVSCASVTNPQKDACVAAAMSSEVALAVDETRYTDESGPRLGSLRADAMVEWPGFPAEAHRFGLHASLSIPLFGGRGTPIAALHLFGPDTGAMAPLSAAVLAAFESYGDGIEPGCPDLGPAALQLVEGLIGALAVRTRIQLALGVIMAGGRTSADSAYAVLRTRAVTHGSALTAVAESILARAGDHPHP
jgi:hypothetical protein